MRIAILTFCTCLLLVSCKRKQHPEYEQKILGEWKFEKRFYKPSNPNAPLTAPPPGYYFHSTGLIFFKDNNLENKDGFVHYKLSNPYLGTKTQYKFVDDGISILNPIDNKWNNLKVVAITMDTLTLEYPKDLYLKYSRLHYTIDTSFRFDQVIVTVGAWSTVKAIMLCNTGDIISCENTFRKAPYFTAKINKNILETIRREFQKANVSKLKEEYNNNSVSDGANVSVTFIKNGQIIKSISDYEQSAPFEFIWAYTPLLHLQQNLKPDSIKNTPNEFTKFFTVIADSKNTCRLSESESFYLCNLLRVSKSTKIAFTHKYNLDYYYSEKGGRITTDGRFYQFTYKNGAKKTYDIGFNFIERNKEVLKFEDKPKEKHAAN